MEARAGRRFNFYRIRDPTHPAHVGTKQILQSASLLVTAIVPGLLASIFAAISSRIIIKMRSKFEQVNESYEQGTVAA